jgi:uncharacterized membrane protein
MVLPHLIALGQPLSFRGYLILFLAENILLSFFIALLLLKIASGWWSRNLSLLVLGAYVLLVVTNALLLLGRYDIFPALLILLVLLSAVAGRPLLVGFWLGVSIAAKLYPVVLLPIFSVYYFVRREYPALVRLVLGRLVTTCLILLPFALAGSEQLLSFLKYHQLRGLQLETLPSGLLLLAYKLRLIQAKTIFNYGAFHTVSPLADNLLKWLPLTFLLLSSVAIVCWAIHFRREWRETGTITPESLVTYITATLLIFAVTNKVFSPQYMIWLLPFAVLLRPRQIGLFAAICLITPLIYPVLYEKLVFLQVILILLLNLRNILIVMLTLWLLVEHFPNSARTELPRLSKMSWKLDALPSAEALRHNIQELQGFVTTDRREIRISNCV